MLYSIGHSTHRIEAFIALLQQHAITALADVRSIPYSRFAAQYRREPLAASLNAAGIRYVFLGRELGARSDNLDCYDDTGRVRYDRLAQTPLFRRGLDRLHTGMKAHRIALMCAEKDPADCHRALLVAQALHADGVAVSHIHADGRQEAHDALLHRLAGTRQDDLLPDADAIPNALRRQQHKIAWVNPAMARRKD